MVFEAQRKMYSHNGHLLVFAALWQGSIIG